MGSIVPTVSNWFGSGGGSGITSPISTIGASAITAGLNYAAAKQASQAQKDVNAENVRLGQEQMAFQERMSSTAFQRAAADLRAAGINPMLASTAQESSPSGAMPSLDPIPPTIQSFATSAKDTIAFLQSVQESNARIKASNASADASRASAGLSVTSQQKMSADAYISQLKRQIMERLVHSAKDLWTKKEGGIESGMDNLGIPHGILDDLMK